MRCFTRAVKRTGYNAWYTEGFNPHLYLMFVSPLSLGFESDYEAVDIRLDEDCDLDDFLNLLNDSLPHGIKATDIGPAVISYKELGYSSWEIKIYGDQSVINKESVLRYANQETILVNKKTKKGVDKQEDIKQFIKKIEIREETEALTIDCIFVTNLSSSLNPMLFLEGLWAYLGVVDIPDVKITRKMLLDTNGQKMQ